MKNVIKLSICTLLIGFTHGAIAENRVPAELAENISPAYRSGDMKSFSDQKFVWVKRIEGRDPDGRSQVLFNDTKGALIPLDKLSQAYTLINPALVEKKGAYQELQLRLGNTLLSLDKTGITEQPLPNELDNKMALHGQVEVGKFAVSSRGWNLNLPDSHKLAQLNN